MLMYPARHAAAVAIPQMIIGVALGECLGQVVGIEKDLSNMFRLAMGFSLEITMNTAPTISPKRVATTGWIIIPANCFLCTI